MSQTKMAGILVVILLLAALGPAGAQAGMLEYPIMPGPGSGVGDKINSLFGKIADDLGSTPAQPSSPPAVKSVVQPTQAQAWPTAAAVIINGNKVPFEAYTIDNRTYFKLRDLAMALNGSPKQFEVSWDGTRNAINLLTNQPYTVNGGELTAAAATSIKSAILSTAGIYLNGEEVALTAYVIDGRTYFKLRDLGAAINFGVGWDGAANAINIDTAANYVAE